MSCSPVNPCSRSASAAVVATAGPFVGGHQRLVEVAPTATRTTARVHTTLAELGIDAEIKEQPFGLPMTAPFPEDAADEG